MSNTLKTRIVRIENSQGLRLPKLLIEQANLAPEIEVMADHLRREGVGMVRRDVKRFDVYLVTLNPTMGSEYQKTRPCTVVSPDGMNRHIATVIIALVTSVTRAYPSRVACLFDGQAGRIVLDQLHVVDKSRLNGGLGT